MGSSLIWISSSITASATCGEEKPELFCKLSAGSDYGQNQFEEDYLYSLFGTQGTGGQVRFFLLFWPFHNFKICYCFFSIVTFVTPKIRRNLIQSNSLKMVLNVGGNPLHYLQIQLQKISTKSTSPSICIRYATYFMTHWIGLNPTNGPL